MSIPALLHVLKHSKTLQSHQLVLLRLADHANLHGVAWPSVATLMGETSYKRKWIEQVLEALVTVGELTRKKWGGPIAITSIPMMPKLTAAHAY